MPWWQLRPRACNSHHTNVIENKGTGRWSPDAGRICGFSGRAGRDFNFIYFYFSHHTWSSRSVKWNACCQNLGGRVGRGVGGPTHKNHNKKCMHKNSLIWIGRVASSITKQNKNSPTDHPNIIHASLRYHREFAKTSLKRYHSHNRP